MKAILDACSTGACAGGRCTSCPFSMGPIGSPIAQFGVQITDSPYVAVNMKIMTRMGAAAARGARADGEFVPCLHSVGMPLAAGTAGCRLAVQSRRRQVHRALPGRARDLELRLRLRRQRAARQEVPRPAHRLDIGTRRRLARRAHADHRASNRPEGREDVRRGGVPERVRQDELRHAHPAAGIRRRRLEGHDRRRRHRLDQAGRRRQALRDQPRGRLLRRRARHDVRRPTRTRWSRSGRTRSSRTSPSPTTATSGGKAWTATPPAHAIDWQGNDWTPESDDARRRTPTPASRRRRRSARSLDPDWDDPKGVPISAFIFGGRRATDVPLVVAERSTGRSACTWPRRWARRRRPPRSATGRGPPRPVRDAAVLRLPHGRLLQPLARSSGGTLPQPPADLPGQLVPPRRRRQVRVARLRREHAGPEVDRRRSRGRARRRSRARSAGCRATRTSTGGSRGFSEQDFSPAWRSTRRDWDAELLEVEELFMKLHTRLPTEMKWIRSLTASALWRSPDHWEMNPDPT